MDDPPFEMPPLPDDVTVVWTTGAWRCELWGSAEAGLIVIYNGLEVVLRRPAQGSADVKETAEVWLARIGGDSTPSGLPEPSRRRIDHRRMGQRGGRRTADHDPT